MLARLDRDRARSLAVRAILSLVDVQRGARRLGLDANQGQPGAQGGRALLGVRPTRGVGVLALEIAHQVGDRELELARRLGGDRHVVGCPGARGSAVH